MTHRKSQVSGAASIVAASADFLTGPGEVRRVPEGWVVHILQPVADAIGQKGEPKLDAWPVMVGDAGAHAVSRGVSGG